MAFSSGSFFTRFMAMVTALALVYPLNSLFLCQGISSPILNVRPSTSVQKYCSISRSNAWNSGNPRIAWPCLRRCLRFASKSAALQSTLSSVNTVQDSTLAKSRQDATRILYPGQTDDVMCHVQHHRSS